MAKEITVGSIIHLQNGAPNGGYLDMRGWLTEKPVVQHWADPHILALVSTHETENRSMGSGSWEIVSAQGRPIGEPLRIGDEIHLRNVYAGAGYLDTFEWVQNLAPFRRYGMDAVQIGVFTSSTAKRGGGLSGTWKIRSAPNKGEGQPLEEGDVIYLENGFRHPHFEPFFLRTYGSVAEHELFKSYGGQQFFVFAGATPYHSEDTWHKWTVTLSSPPESFYYLWGDVAGKWLDFGVLRNRSLRGQAITALKISSGDEGKRLVGKVAYHGEGYVDFEAVWAEPNRYEVIHRLNEQDLERYPNGRWLLGGRDDKKIIAMDVTSADNGRSFTGTITYAGEPPINIKGHRATTTLFNKKQRTILYDFFEPTLWEEKVNRISNALATAVTELDQALFSIDGFSLVNLTALLNAVGSKSYQYLIKEYYIAKALKTLEPADERRFWQFLRQSGGVKAIFEQIKKEKHNKSNTSRGDFSHLNEKVSKLLKTQTPPSLQETCSQAIDFEFQVIQLLNIYTLWRNMDEFWQLLSHTSIQCINQLNAAHILPPVHRMRDCFQQFTMDFEIIQSAIQQRQWLKTTNANSLANLQAGSLVITDKLAAMALAPFQHLLSEAAHMIPITYFSKTIHIRQLPYTDQFVFVGLTYDLTASLTPGLAAGEPINQIDAPAFELMAIPHEMGHFMYHHAQLKYETHGTFTAMSKQFAHNPYYHWCEEIFADLYGCVISGPFTILGLQALLAAKGAASALKDDEAHPTPILRPFFLSEMLQTLSRLQSEQYDFADVAMTLDANWTAVLERWGFVTENVVNGRPARIQLPSDTQTHTENFINIGQAIHNVKPIIETFARALLTLAQFDPWSANTTDAKLLSATIPWCQRQPSLPQYVDQIRQLAGHNFASKKVPHTHLSQEYQLKQSIKDEVTAVLRERNDHISSKLFQNILEGWHDSGPHGTGGHD
ncbi:MAG: hypothetical protein H6658_18135 [Ardenticatenaceae bacterium]|nr:hypothetical protein [Ardenticatenaceae bacterium]